MASRLKLKRVVIRGFRSVAFRSPLTLEVGKVCVLMGANGAGKSNVVGFFQLLGNLIRGSLQRYVEEAGTAQTFLYYGAQKTPSLLGMFFLEDEEGRRYDYQFSLSHALPDRLIVAMENVAAQEEKDGLIQPNALPTNFKESELAEAKDEASLAIWDFLSRCKVYQFSDSSAEGGLRQASPVDGAHYLQERGNNLASFLYYLRESYPENYKRIVEYVRTVMPQFRDFYLQPRQGYVSLTWMDDSANDYVLIPQQFSDGTIRFIALATLLLQPEETMPSVILIDEPELGLHPYAIRQLAEMIKDASFHAQVIVATQSPLLMDEFELADISIIEWDETLKSSVRRELNEGELAEWLDNYSLSELWEKNVLGGRPV